MKPYRDLTPAEKEAVLEERRLRGAPLHSPPHLYDARGTFLITAATVHRLSQLAQPGDRRWFEELIRHTYEEAELPVAAWVILPDHYHLIVEADPLRRVTSAVRRVHAVSAAEFNRRDGTPGRQVWYRYTDRQIRGTDHLGTALNYVHQNPVKHGLSVHPFSWEASSVHRYRIQWGREAMEEHWLRFPVLAFGSGWDD